MNTIEAMAIKYSELFGKEMSKEEISIIISEFTIRMQMAAMADKNFDVSLSVRLKKSKKRRNKKRLIMRTIYWVLAFGDVSTCKVLFATENSLLVRSEVSSGEYLLDKKGENEYWFTTLEAAEAAAEIIKNK